MIFNIVSRCGHRSVGYLKEGQVESIEKGADSTNRTAKFASDENECCVNKAESAVEVKALDDTN